MEFGGIATYLPLVLAGAGVGLLVGMTGVGGGAIMTPLLISTFGVAPPVAVGTDLLFAAITKLSAGFRHHRMGNVNWRIVTLLAAGSVPAAALTLVWLSMRQADMQAVTQAIRIGLAFALPISALAILLYPLLMRGHPSNGENGSSTSAALTVAFGVALGVLVTLTSVGAGAVGVAVLAALYPALAARRVVGVDIAHAIPLTFIGGIGHMGLGHVDFMLLIALLAGSIPGMWVGTSFAGRAPDWLLRPILAIVLCYAAWSLYWK